MSTYSAKPGELESKWFIVDAGGKTLGRIATKIAVILQGKNKPTYTAHVDTGDHIIVINAGDVVLTGNKLDGKQYYRHTGWMGGLVSTSAREMLEKKPTELITFAVKGMLPKTKLGKQMIKKMKVYAGPAPAHGYEAQGAEVIEL